MINDEQDHELLHAQGDAHLIPGTPAGGAAAPRKMGFGQKAVVFLLLMVVLVPPLGGFYSYFTGKSPLHWLSPRKEDGATSESPAATGISPVPGQPHMVEVSEGVVTRMGIRKDEKDAVAVAQPPTRMRPMVLPGSTAIIPGRLARIKPRFASARVVELGQVQDRNPKTGYTEYRELRPGDRVTKGQLLGVFYSVDVGSKKNDLLQALVQLELDQKIMDRYEANRMAIPEVLFITQMRQLQGDRTEMNRALNNLKTWEIPQEEIDALRSEARKISANKDEWFQTPEGRWQTRAKQAMEAKGSLLIKPDPGKESHAGKHDPGKESPGSKLDASKESLADKLDPGKEEEIPWGRVTMVAPFDGVIIEQNVFKGDMVTDPTVNLFQIAEVRRLLVIASCPEDDLPALDSLQGSDKRWIVKTAGSPETGLSGSIAEFSYLIDPNQHTAVIKGYVDNPGEHIRGGQYVTATVNIPPPRDVVEIPVDALVDDGRQSLVFVQPDAARHQFAMRRVLVTHRFDRTVFVRATPIPKDEQLTAREAEEGLLPQEPLQPGERVLLVGSLELKRVVIDLDSRPRKNPSDLLARTKTRPAPDVESPPEQKTKAGKG